MPPRWVPPPGPARPGSRRRAATGVPRCPSGSQHRRRRRRAPERRVGLSRHFTVINYDRRGGGDSGDTQPYAAEREIEDLDALIDAAGGSACLWGLSSGAALALETADRLGSKVMKLPLYEVLFYVDDSRPRVPEGFQENLEALVAAGRRGAITGELLSELILLTRPSTTSLSSPGNPDPGG